MLEYQNIKTFLHKFTLQIGQKTILWLKKWKILYRGHMLLMILMENKSLERFTKTNCEKQIKKNLEQQKQEREKVINLMLVGKDAIVRLIVASIKKDIV